MGLVEGDGLEGSFKGRRVWRRRPGGSLSKQDCTPVGPQLQPKEVPGISYPEPEVPSEEPTRRGSNPFSASALPSGN